MRAAIVLLCLLASACRRADAPRLAVVVPLTGDSGGEGQGVARAVELAAAEANEARSLPYRLDVVALDDRASPGEAERAAALVVADPRVVAVIGHYNSGCSIVAARAYARAGIPMVTPASTSPELTAQQLEPGWPGPRNVFRLVPTDDAQGAFAAGYARRRLGLRSVAVLHDGTPYGAGLAEIFRKAFAAAGGRVPVFEETRPGARDLSGWLERSRAAGAEGLFFGGVYREAALLLRQARAAGLRQPFILGDGAGTDSLFAAAGEAADGAYVAALGRPAEETAQGRAFTLRYERRYAGQGVGPKPFDRFAYEAARIVVEALRKSGPDRGRLLAALRRTRHRGLLGVVAFDEKGDVLGGTVRMTRASWRGKRFVAAP